MKEPPFEITVNKRVNAALDALSPQEKESVYQAINNLGIFGIEPSLGAKINKLKTDEPLYLLRVNPSLRLILKVTNGDKIDILDIVMRDRLKIFAANNS